MTATIMPFASTISPRRFRPLAPWAASLFIHAMIILIVWRLISPPTPAARGVSRPIFIPQPTAANSPLIPAPIQPAAHRSAAPVELSAGLSTGAPPPPPIALAASPAGEFSSIASGAYPSSPRPLDGIVSSNSAPPPPAAPRPSAPLIASALAIAGDAPSVAYVCDASGSMVGDRMAHLKIELRNAIGSLRPIQAFTIIFFKRNRAAAFSTRLVMATGSNKQRAYAFLDGVQVEDAGATNPLPALDQAFDARPAVIYLLTDGGFADDQAVVRLIAQRNSDHAVKINTIAFLGADATFEPILKRIAADNGGVFKRVTRELLNDPGAAEEP